MSPVIFLHIAYYMSQLGTVYLGEMTIDYIIDFLKFGVIWKNGLELFRRINR